MAGGVLHHYPWNPRGRDPTVDVSGLRCLCAAAAAFRPYATLRGLPGCCRRHGTTSVSPLLLPCCYSHSTAPPTLTPPQRPTPGRLATMRNRTHLLHAGCAAASGGQPSRPRSPCPDPNKPPLATSPSPSPARRTCRAEDDPREHLPQAQLPNQALAHQPRPAAAVAVALPQVPHRQADGELPRRRGASSRR